MPRSVRSASRPRADRRTATPRTEIRALHKDRGPCKLRRTVWVDHVRAPFKGPLFFRLAPVPGIALWPVARRSKESFVQSLAHSTQAADMTAISAVMEPVLRAHDVVAVEVTFRTEPGGWVLRVTVEPTAAALASSTETPSGNVQADLAALAEISRDLSLALDVADVVPHRYNLEVSSPGLDRPLYSAGDFARFAGKIAKVHLIRPASDGQRVLRGRIVSADTARAEVTLDADGKLFTLTLSDVSRANLVFELTPQPKRGRPQSPKHRNKNER